MLNPGQNSTSWQSTWNHGKTQTIRVPIALASQILSYAKALDQGLIYLDEAQCQQTILKAIDQFVEMRLSNFHPNQYACIPSTNTRRWDELRRLRNLIAQEPSKIFATNFNPRKSEHYPDLSEHYPAKPASSGG